MGQAVRASNTPFAVDVETGKSYWWCACGRSAKQPFCDGSHKKETGITPVKWDAPASTKVYFCGCKSTATAPLCDGTHKKG